MSKTKEEKDEEKRMNDYRKARGTDDVALTDTELTAKQAIE